jgi:hypothetical protein
MPEDLRSCTDPVMMLRIEDFARRCGVGRTIVFRAANPDPDYRRGLPYLPTVKLGRCRGVRPETGRQWLAELERATVEMAV